MRYQQLRFLYNSLKTDRKAYLRFEPLSKRSLSDNSQRDGSAAVSKIRTFSIIAHVDHGKSTLADRILELCGAISKDVDNKQVLDKLQVERERGITVKAQTATISYDYRGDTYTLNLIDTPGHVDFSYEVSRSLSACQGVVLLVDAAQGIQAQTMANFYLAFASNLVIIPVLNKIDLKTADVESCVRQLVSVFEMNEVDILQISAKRGLGIEELLDAVVERIPPPGGDPNGKFRALLFDSWFEKFRGVIVNVSVVDGKIGVGDTIVAAHSQRCYEVKEIGRLMPDPTPGTSLECGQVGYIIPGMKTSKEAQIGDTLHKSGEQVEHFPGFRPAKPVVFAGIFPVNQSENEMLRNAIEKLTLNDSSVSVSTEGSAALGQGWRLGFLGLLHMEVFTQRLDQEYDMQVIVTTPSVPYKAHIVGRKNIKAHRSDEIWITNPSEFPERSIVSEYLEPMVVGTIIMPQEYLGAIISLCTSCRGTHKDSVSIDEKRMMVRYKLPLNEILVNFFDDLKLLTSGYASFDYEECGYETSELSKLEFMLNGKYVDELAIIVHPSRAREIGKKVCARLKEVLPQQLFKVSIQAAVGGKIVGREDMFALKKNVLAKCYGGDVSRKMKLLKRQAEGKKRMRLIGKVEVPVDAFVKILKR